MFENEDIFFYRIMLILLYAYPQFKLFAQYDNKYH